MNYFATRRFGPLITLLASMVAVPAHASPLINDPLSDGYSDCFARDNGDNTATVFMTIHFKKAEGHTAGLPFMSRALLITSYDKFGNPNDGNYFNAREVWINDVLHDTFYAGSSYRIFVNTKSPIWKTEDAFSARVVAIVDNNNLSWPAINIQAGNYAVRGDIGESKGGVYIDLRSSEHRCSVADPGKPPPAPIRLDVSLPGTWEVGELQTGRNTLTLGKASDQLCFDYRGDERPTNERFRINATASNGTQGDHYQLLPVKAQSGSIPYSVTLSDTRDSSNTFTLPNVFQQPIRLPPTDKTCFTPSITTDVDASTPTDDYLDSLTLEVTMMP